MGTTTIAIHCLLAAGMALWSCAAPSSVSDSEAEHCTDGTLSADESEVDCGGSCPPCQLDDCGDGLLSPHETDVDCGGACSPCLWGLHCVTDADCASGGCVASQCHLALSWGGHQQDLIEDIETDAAGNLLLAGTASDGLLIGDLEPAVAGNGDALYGSVSRNGEIRWVVPLGTSLPDKGVAIETIAAGFVVAGDFQGETTIGATALTSAGFSDAFLAWLSPAGEPLFAARFGGAGVDYFSDVEATADAIAATGAFSGDIAFGAQEWTTTSGMWDVFVASLAHDGFPLWSHRFGGSELDAPGPIAVDAQGAVVTCATFVGTADLDGGASFVSRGSQDVWFARFDAGGALSWSASFGGDNSDTCDGLVLLADGTMVFVGTFRNQVDFGVTTLTTEFLNQTNVFVVALASTGEAVWAHSINVTPTGLRAAPGADDEVVIAFPYKQSFMFAGTTFMPEGAESLFVGRLASGVEIAGQQVVSSDDAVRAGALWLDAAGRMFVGGSFRGTANLAGFPRASTGGLDAFIVDITW